MPKKRIKLNNIKKLLVNSNLINSKILDWISYSLRKNQIILMMPILIILTKWIIKQVLIQKMRKKRKKLNKILVYLII